ncbi:MAG: hypothetical protein AB7V46_08935, partial [Thermomicrobiales bacterium]
ALGLLDQVSAFRRRAGEQSTGQEAITVEDVRDLLGLSRDEMIVQLASAIGRRDAADALSILLRATNDGADPRQINRQLVQFLRDVMHFLADPRSSEDADIARVAGLFTLAEAMAEAERFSEVDFKVRHNLIPQLPLEIGIVGSVLRNGATTPAANVRPEAPEGQTGQSATSERTTSTRQDEVKRPTRPGSLSDRVRGPQRSGEASSAPKATAHSTADDSASGSLETRSVSIDQVRTSWDQIRANLKARSRRIEALFMSVDPAAVHSNLISLTSAYPFHRNKLNEPEVQQVVEEAISEVLGVRIRVTTLLHGEGPPTSSGAGQQLVAAAASTSTPKRDTPGPDPLDPDGQKIIDTVKNLFDAEEIEP